MLSWGRVGEREGLCFLCACGVPGLGQAPSCHPQTLQGESGAQCLRRGTRGRGGQVGSPPLGQPVPKAQVYTTSMGWGPATGARGSALKGQGGWVGVQTDPRALPACRSRPRGLPGQIQAARPGPVPGPPEKPPCGQRFPGAGPGSKTGWRVRSEDGVPAPGEDPWPRDNGQQKGLTVSLA